MRLIPWWSNLLYRLLLVECARCAGTGFSGCGTGYGDVCDDCGGQLREWAVGPRWTWTVAYWVAAVRL